MINEIRDIPAKFLLAIFQLFPLDKKKVVLKSFRGQNCGDNPGALYKVLRQRRPDLKYYWVMCDTNTCIDGAKIIKHGSIAELYHLATAILWIDNKRKGLWCSKRKGQFYLQTWHGGISGKKVEADARGSLSGYYLLSAKKDSKNADLFLSDSKWTTNLYRRAFFYNGNILECGLPKADILYRSNFSIKQIVYNYFSIDEDIKLALYAPTFRVDGNLDAYNIDYLALQNALIHKFGGKWKVIVRLHPNVAGKAEKLSVDKDITINGSKYQDINELIVASEVLITDYSSCMFDAMEAGKKVFLFATDIETYDADRGRYFKFSELPFSLATNNEEMANIIKSFCEKDYINRVEHFKKKLGFVDGGHACETVCNYLEQVL